jgi:hypothetical protein
MMRTATHDQVACKDEMGDAPGLGTKGTIGQHALGNERDNDEVARIVGLDRIFNADFRGPKNN